MSDEVTTFKSALLAALNAHLDSDDFCWTEEEFVGFKGAISFVEVFPFVEMFPLSAKQSEEPV